MDSQIRQIHQQLVTKNISCTALIHQKLDALKQNTNYTVNSLLESLAIELAAKVDAKIAKGKPIGLF